MGNTARITVTSGPDRGKVFQLNEELVHVGSGGDNQIALTDKLVADHQASIVSREGRYAIYTPLEEAVQIDGNAIPPERWVWLPSSAQIAMSERTSFTFDEMSGNAAAPSEKPAAGGNKPPQRSGKAKRSAKRRKASAQPVARFITDSQGDTLVKLGEDGHLPELQLAEGETHQVAEASQKKQSNPIALYAVLGFSMCASLLLAVVDFEPAAVSKKDRDVARKLIVRYYGTTEDELKPYQELLREARLARSRGDLKTERQTYARVLNLLNAEDISQSFSGLTGDKGNSELLPEDDATFLRQFERENLPMTDQVLRRLISIMMRR